MTIHSFKSEQHKNMLLGVGFICLVVLWLASILFKTKLSDKTGIQIISATLMDEWREVANC